MASRNTFHTVLIKPHYKTPACNRFRIFIWNTENLRGKHKWRKPYKQWNCIYRHQLKSAAFLPLMEYYKVMQLHTIWACITLFGLNGMRVQQGENENLFVTCCDCSLFKKCKLRSFCGFFPCKEQLCRGCTLFRLDYSNNKDWNRGIFM